MDLSSPSDLEKMCYRVLTATHNMAFVDMASKIGI
jgi:hypothetical protein